MRLRALLASWPLWAAQTSRCRSHGHKPHVQGMQSLPVPYGRQGGSCSRSDPAAVIAWCSRRPQAPDHGVSWQEDAALAESVQKMAQLALLGLGGAADMYPDTLDELYAASAEEQVSRIML